MSDPACRNFRELLGVYVVGAIEPNERGLLDAHLSQCYGCREELAGLAVLPALLHRIPAAEAEQIALVGQSGADHEDPAPGALSGLLSEVRTRRRTRRLRTVLAAAAALIVAVSGSAAVTSVLQQDQGIRLDLVTASHGGMSGAVKYGSAKWGTQILTRVSGIPRWTICKLWVTADGHTQLAGIWGVNPGDSWYPSTANVPPTSITSFKLTSDGKVLLRWKAT